MLPHFERADRIVLSAGVHVKAVSERLGHSSTSFTMDAYSAVIRRWDERQPTRRISCSGGAGPKLGPNNALPGVSEESACAGRSRAPGRNRTCDSRFRNSMQPRLLTCENTLKWVSEQAIPSLEDSFVTRRFPVFRGTTAGPIR
jgi:hypothetical protein